MLGALLKRLLQQGRRDPAAAADALRLARQALHADNFEAAQTAIAAALRADPREPDAYLLRAAVAKRQRRFPAAAMDFRSALGLRPDSIDIRLDLAAVLHTSGSFQEALSVMDEALALNPRHAVACMNRGLMLRELGRFGEAEAALRRGCDLDPLDAACRCHLAAVLADQGQSGEARALLEQVLANDADHVDAHWTLATLLLSEGRYVPGWDHYEHRLRRHDTYVRRRTLPWYTPQSHCEGPLLVLAEQGLGDEIMFASCFGDLLARHPDCCIECDPRLGSLFTRSFPRARILATRDAASTIAPATAGASAQVAAGTLPRFFRRSPEEFRAHNGYLQADTVRTDRWRARLATLGPGLKLGISWVGGSLKTRRALRSLTLAQLEPILRVPATHFVSLQYTPCEAELAELTHRTGIVIHQWPEAIADYDETASLVAALDGVISVTTSIVHLTGALGKPVWVLVPSVPEWRYQRSGSDLPWYPSARLFRQRTLGEWAPVVAEVESALNAWSRTQPCPTNPTSR